MNQILEKAGKDFKIIIINVQGFIGKHGKNGSTEKEYQQKWKLLKKNHIEILDI